MTIALRSTMSEEETQVRTELAAAHRVAAREGMDDGIWNHLSVAVPGRDDAFLLKPHALFFSEVTASSLITVGLDGTLLGGQGEWTPAAFHIHGCIHRAFPELRCVMHLHPLHATALACAQDSRLLAISQDTMRFYGRLAHFDDYGGLALDEAEADRMVEAMRGHTVLMMANHGVLVGGRTVAEALYEMHYLEVACRAQTVARQAAPNGDVRVVSGDIASLASRQLNENRLEYAQSHLAAEMRRLDREAADYRQ